MNIELTLNKAISASLSELLNIPTDQLKVSLQKTRKEFKGDYTLVVFPYTKILKESPEKVAERFGNHLMNSIEFISDFNVVKGFLNLSVSQEMWLKFYQKATKTENFGFSAPESKGRKMVEYSSPNTNKPLHLGHLRNNFLGYSISKILEANGHKVVKVQIVNDRGIHICKSMLAWKKFGNGDTPQSTGIKGDHFVGKFYVLFDQKYKEEVQALINSGSSEKEAKQNAPLMLEAQQMLKSWEEGDVDINALWSKMNAWVYEGFDHTYKTMGVEFDKLYYESDTYILGKEKVEKHLDHPLFFKKDDGSVWINLEGEKLDHKLLLRSDGTSVYMTQDIGTAIKRDEEFDCENYYYVVGNEQDYHFKVLAIILEKMGYEFAKGIEHVSYGMVDLPEGKMKSREGTVVDADDLMKEMEATALNISEELGKTEGLTEEEKNTLFHTIGLGALKYFILKVDPKKRMLFDPKESVDFNGNTGPFIQYTYARIQSILRKNNLDNNSELPEEIDLNEMDFDLIKKWHEFPQTIIDAGHQLSPSIIANYIYDLVKTFNHFYQNSPSIMSEENEAVKNFRLNICFTTASIIERGMGILGIQVPNRM